MADLTLTREQIEEIKKSLQNTTNSYIGRWVNYDKEYQEPERDEQGVFYGYKVLIYTTRDLWSPIRTTRWSQDGNLKSDYIPTEQNSSGIYFCKTENNMELMHIARYHRCAFFVKCALSGVVIEGETGFRSQYAQIIAIKIGEGWLSYEYWKDYQDTQGHSKNHSCQDTIEDAERGWKGYWSINP